MAWRQRDAERFTLGSPPVMNADGSRRTIDP